MLEIEIIETNLIEGGIEVFARAWKNKVQIGFGDDGTVDIERFRIINPPILVPDKKGSYVRVVQEDKELDIKYQEIRYREDAEEALLQSLEHTINLVSKDGSRIILGKTGNTTSTFYPEASGGSSSFDGYMDGAGNSTFLTARNLTTANAANTDRVFMQTLCDKRGSDFHVSRSMILFDTSAIPSGDTVSSAILSLYEAPGFGLINTNSASCEIVQTNPASDNNLVVADFNKFTFSSLSSKTLSSISLSNYNNFTLNDNSVVSKIGATKLGYLISNDVTATAPTGNNRLYFSTADVAGTSQDPKLVVVHSGGGGGFVPTPMLQMLQITGGII